VVSKVLTKRKFAVTLTIAALLVALVPSVVPGWQTATAACSPALPTDKGTVTLSGNIPSAGTYRAWFRIQAPSTTANNFYFQVDETVCNVSVGGGSAIPANTWTWIDYRDGNTASKINLTLTAGSHTFKMAGQAGGVLLDRVLLTTDTACTPTGTGDNCGPVTVILQGDLNLDGAVGILDLSILLSNWNGTSATADINGSGKVDILDLSVLLSNWSG
jgi:hypothetical protein